MWKLKNISNFYLKNISSTTRNFFNRGVNRPLDNTFIEINHDIVDASKPCVALESTIITHGMPYPTNFEMALEVENEIRYQGAQPVTIGYLNGKLKVGMTKYEIEILAKNKSQAFKISRRDLPYIFSNQSNGPVYGGNFNEVIT